MQEKEKAKILSVVKKGGVHQTQKTKNFRKRISHGRPFAKTPKPGKRRTFQLFSLFFLRVARAVVFPDLGLKALGPFRVPVLGLLELSFSLFSLEYPEIIAQEGVIAWGSQGNHFNHLFSRISGAQNTKGGGQNPAYSKESWWERRIYSFDPRPILGSADDISWPLLVVSWPFPSDLLAISWPSPGSECFAKHKIS